MNRGLIKYLVLLLAWSAFEPYSNATPTIQLSRESIQLRSSELPGYSLAQQRCGTCHSADYIEYQPPGFDREQWTGLIRKMKESYGAPLSDNDVNVIGKYLAATYSGEPSALPVPPTKATDLASMPIGRPVTDVKALLDQNACLSCHAIDKKIVGLAYRDVAERYRNDGNALMHVIERIGQGGSGRWGEIPMPAFSGLSQQEKEQLADFVLRQ